MRNICFLVFFQVLLISISHAQEEKNIGISFQLSSGYANTFHYNAPTPTPVYIERTNYFKQYPLISPQFELSFLISISQHLKINGGIGLSSYSFYQEREDIWVFGLDSYPIIKQTFNYNFASYFMGMRHTFTGQKIKPFLGFKAHFDKNLVKEFSVEQGFSLKAEMGLCVKLNEHISAITDFFYKSAITAYNRNKNYYPYQGGIEIGFQFHL